MKAAREIITSILEEELPDIVEAKHEIITSRIVNELGLNNVRCLNVDKGEKEYEDYFPVKYNLELSLEDILLVEKHNGTDLPLLFDPLYTHVLKCYFTLLGKESGNTVEISEKDCIKKIVSSNKNTSEAKTINAMANPVAVIRNAIDNVCEALPKVLKYKNK